MLYENENGGGFSKIMKPIQTAIAGFGLSGRYFHAPFLEKNKDFKLVRGVRRGDHLPAELSPDVQLSSFSEVLEDPGIELLVVATPNLLHAEMTRAALLAGKHVVLEKPMASDGEQARELIELAGKCEKQIFVFHNRRLDGDFLSVRKIVESALLGELVEYEAHFDRWSPKLGSGARGWKEVDEPSISILHDLGTHLVDQAVALFGRPFAVTGKLVRQRPGSQISDGFTLLLDYGGLQVTLRSSLLVRQEGFHFLLNGSRGSFVKKGMDPQEADLRRGRSVLDPAWGVDAKENHGKIRTSLGGLEIEGSVDTLPGNYMEFYNRVAGALRGGGAPLLSVDEALVTVDILDAAIASHRQGRTMPF